MLAQHLAHLKEWLRIPSVSANPSHQPDVLQAAQWLAHRLMALGLEQVQLLPTEGYPVVYGHTPLSPDRPTILVYGHYDVQPPDPLELWTTGAFDPTERDGNLYARGATDDKGQVYCHVAALEELLKEGELPCNVKFFIEGEEEVGSASLEAALEQYKDLLAADCLLISDTSLISLDIPSLTVSLRGMAYMEVEVTGPNRDLHSGVYGGAVDNPINVLAGIIARLKDEEGRVTIRGFYDRVRRVDDHERIRMAQVPFSEKDYKQHLGLKALAGEVDYSTPERASIRPTLDVNGIWGGYTGQGAKTVLPAKAHAKISMRLVPDQRPDEIAQLFADHVQRLAPPTVQVKVYAHHGGLPFRADTRSAAYQAAEDALEEVFGKKPIGWPEGGSIPILTLFQQSLGVPIVLMGFGLNTDAPHSPNEHFGIENFNKGIMAVKRFHHHLRRRLKPGA